MDKDTLNEVLDIMTGERTVFRYGRDGYALSLLQHFVGQRMSIRELKNSPFAHLLDKPLLKRVVAENSGNAIDAEQLELAKWHSEQEPLNFVLTLDSWGDGKNTSRRWMQMSRSGYQLVLQLNFANDHEQKFRQLIKTDEVAAFSSIDHPVLSDGSYETLAWARIDLDFASDTVLIEEIQSDWVRQAQRSWNHYIYTEGDFDSYLGDVLAPYAKVWHEAVLTAAIELVQRDLGFSHIYYNTFDTGNKLKAIEHCPPPRSLYSTIPRRFGFKETQEIPAFLRELRHVRKARNGGLSKRKQRLKNAKRVNNVMTWFKLPTKGESYA